MIIKIATSEDMHYIWWSVGIAEENNIQCVHPAPRLGDEKPTKPLVVGHTVAVN